MGMTYLSLKSSSDSNQGDPLQLLQRIQAEIQSKHMLSHPFYQDWMAGTLTQGQLQNYAVQYLPFVDSFPRFVSATHSLCDSAEGRALLLENLMDEEGKGHSTAHPELWRNFCSGIGSSIAANPVYGEKAVQLRDQFMALSRSSYAEGLSALYAYESQIPEIAKAKIKGLADNYQVSDLKTTEFFRVHEKADVYHSKACAGLIGQIKPEDADAAVAAARKATTALWDFLTEVHVQ